eukprot:scaffold283464_cov43-Tisochrysis_lutea.AAC.1
MRAECCSVLSTGAAVCCAVPVMGCALDMLDPSRTERVGVRSGGPFVVDLQMALDVRPCLRW